MILNLIIFSSYLILVSLSFDITYINICNNSNICTHRLDGTLLPILNLVFFSVV